MQVSGAKAPVLAADGEIFMLTDVQRKVLASVRDNARASFSIIGRKHDIPVTTVFDNYERLVEAGLIKKHICVLNFKKAGLLYRAYFLMKGKDRDSLSDFLHASQYVNSIWRVSDYDFSADCVFPTVKDFYDFKDSLEALGLEKLDVHEVYEHVKVEGSKSF